MGLTYPVSHNGEAPLEYGEGGPRIGVKTIALDSDTIDKEYEIGGNVIWVPSASSLDATVEIKYQEERNDAIPIQQGSFIAGPSFSRLYISWSAQAGETITILYTKESIKKPFRIENATADYTGVTISGIVDVKETDNSTLTSAADYSIPATTTANFASALADQVGVYIGNLASNTETLRIGDASTGATRGIELAPGETLFIPTAAALYGYNPGASAQSITILRVRK
jgi:hypothetical protein